MTLAAPGDACVTTDACLFCIGNASDAGAWDRLAQLYGPLVYRWARGRGLQAADAENMVQDVFLAVFDGIAGFRRRLWRISVNRYSVIRRQTAGPRLEMRG